ncbi:MAG: homogentisate 1,2-dioxygenase [Candidatus Eisenbacteria bacterium]|nr:homogentisate 1,2-dioxygenase [Candidatus Latescibacterota bacterium]MBD3301998.1 homogentisate 1,2-dioxygenase [Candidatus Eisenbacteria bacterium]
MPIYQVQGEIPRKRHVQFRKPDGGLYYEELIGNLGFTGLQSLVYHVHRPTQIRGTRLLQRLDWEVAENTALRPLHLRTSGLPKGGDPLTGRRPLLFNPDVAVSAAFPDTEQGYFYRNAQGDEIVYVTEGSGVLESSFGTLAYRPGDYLVIPRGILHRWRPEKTAHRLLVIESRGYVRTPRRYRNDHGQLLEHAPYCERDIRIPQRSEPRDEEGSFEVRVKRDNALVQYEYARHPFDVVGWDGTYYPWAFNIDDFEPITGRIHQPPPVHQTFEGDGFVVCSFVPRLYDYHPEAIPAPYHHENVGTDEVIYYASREFMSRKGIELGSITCHPDGIPHGPHPGTVEASIGKQETKEVAVMIDTFRPLTLGRDGEAIEDADYPRSWLEP